MGLGRGGPGGQISSQMINYLVRNQGGATWLVAVSSSMAADPIILKTGTAVMAMGGFSGSDPAMTVAKLQQYVKSGQLHYVLTGGGRGFGADGGDSAITRWVTKNCTAIGPDQYGGGSNTTGQALYRCT
jgi:4-amino-4-deoxy-L-arabinose transferase-like glycosyltransferase